MTEKIDYTHKRRRRVKLIFNPNSGKARNSSGKLMEIIRQMQDWKLIPETFILEQDSDLPGIISEARNQGISMYASAGGDGTVSSVARAIAGMPVTMGIIPIGTQNNIARSLGIPSDIPDSIAVLRTGRRIKTDMGLITMGELKMPFIEICSVGLASSVFPSADCIQHGHLEKIGDFLSALLTSRSSQLKLTIDGLEEIKAEGQAVIITNMTYAGRHCRLGFSKAYKDGLLDVHIFSDIHKLDLLGLALSSFDSRDLNDPRISSFRVKRIKIEASPPMSVMSDGIILGEGPLHIEIMPKALGIMTAMERNL